MRRRIALASYVDENYLPGFLALLRSLALTNPGRCVDYIVLYDDLRPSSISAIRELHPWARLRRVDAARYNGFVKGDGNNYLVREAYFILDVFRIRGYDTIITLDTDMVVLGDIGELFRLREGLWAVEQYLNNDEGGSLNSGLLVVNREHLTGEFAACLDETGRTGAYELDKHDQGILNAVLRGGFGRLDPRFNFVKRRLGPDGEVPEDVRILHFTGRHKPWLGGEDGYEAAEAAWHRFDLTPAEFREAFFALDAARHPELVIHFGRRVRGASRTVAMEIAEARRSLGDHRVAAETLREAAGGGDGVGGGGDGVGGDAAFHKSLGQALLALSDYDEAEAHLLLATQDRAVAPHAFALLAELAWIRSDDATAVRYAEAGLDADPLNRKCGILHRRASSARPPGDTGGRLAHVAFYMDERGNAGDKVLPEAVRRCFTGEPDPDAWLSVHAHRLFDDEALARVNAGRGLVVGGGGLFIPDTAPNGDSGWQWNVPIDVIDRIDVPIAVFAVGYNVFEGQPAGGETFRRSLTRLVERAAFVGLRNHGSIDRVRDLLPSSLRERVTYQPCPTTVMNRLVPRSPAERDDVVLVNCAYDRAALRFGHDYQAFLGEMAAAIGKLRERAEVRYSAHAVKDETFVFDLRREHGIGLPVVPLYDMAAGEIWDVYRRALLVIGMRGHAGMMPFGCGTPIISLISHPKLAYFLTDIGRPDWGVSVHDRALGAVLTERAAAMLDGHDEAVRDVERRQDRLWEITQENVRGLPLRPG